MLISDYIMNMSAAIMVTPHNSNKKNTLIPWIPYIFQNMRIYFLIYICKKDFLQIFTECLVNKTAQL